MQLLKRKQPVITALRNLQNLTRVGQQVGLKLLSVPSLHSTLIGQVPDGAVTRRYDDSFV